MEDRWWGSLNYSDHSGQNNSSSQWQNNSDHAEFNTLPKTIILVSILALTIVLNHNGEKLSGISFSTLIPVEAESSKPPILNVYSRKRQSVVTSNEPILDSEIGIEGGNQFSNNTNDLICLLHSTKGLSPALFILFLSLFLYRNSHSNSVP